MYHKNKGCREHVEGLRRAEALHMGEVMEIGSAGLTSVGVIIECDLLLLQVLLVNSPLHARGSSAFLL
jgi:hypothetical protein